MSLLLANLLSTLMALGSLGALIIVGRKANETIKLGKLLTLRVAAASNGLERVAKSLRTSAPTCQTRHSSWKPALPRQAAYAARWTKQSKS